jgi:hypothetical protein
LEVFRGGLAFVRRNRPLLAVAAYHNRDGLWRIPDLLMNSLRDYRFLMRLARMVLHRMCYLCYPHGKAQ